MANILDRIRNLIELSKNNPSTEEAALAAERAQEMMFKYAIGEADLDVGAKHEPEAVVNDVVASSPRLDIWKSSLANGLGKAFGCEMYSSKAGGECKFHIVGVQSNVQTVTYMFSYLCLEIDRLADAGWKANGVRGAGGQAKTWRNSFRLGAVNTIYKRLKSKMDEQKAVVAQREEAAKHTGSTAIALYKSDQERVQEEFKKVGRLRTVRAKSRYNPSAYERGKDAGSNLSLGGGAALKATAKQVRS